MPVPTSNQGAESKRWLVPLLAKLGTLTIVGAPCRMPTNSELCFAINSGAASGVEETRLVVAALRKLGYDAMLRLLPASTFFTYTGDSRNHAQVIGGGWSADYASASDFIGKLTCGKFVARHGLDTTDASEFCDPRFDRQVESAASLQNTRPAAADRLWRRLDRNLTDLALIVPTATPNAVDVVSRHIHNYQYNQVWGALLDQLTIA